MELNNDEKINILIQHIKVVATNIYNMQVLLISEQAASSIDQETVDSLNNRISSENSKTKALELELGKLKVSNG